MRTLAFTLLVALSCAAACPSKQDAPATSLVASAPSVPRAPSLAPLFTVQPAGKRVVVLYTASVQGYVEPCGCTAEPLGGVARLAAAVAAAQEAYGARVLFVDGGDLLFERPDDTAAADACQAEARADLLVSSYARAGLAGTVLGPLDDVRGPMFRDARLARHQVPSLGVNPPRALLAGAPAAAGVLRELGPAKVGITAFRVDGPADFDGAHAGLSAEVARLRGAGADAVIVIAQAPLAITRKLIGDIEGIDVVIQGRAPGEVPVAAEQLTLPSGRPGAVLVASGQQAQQLGVLELVLDGRSDGQALTLDDRRAQREGRAKVLGVRIDELGKQLALTPDGPRQQFLAQRLAAAQAELAAVDGVDAGAPLAGPYVVARSVPLPRGFPEEPTALAALAGYTASVPQLVATCEASLTCPEPAPGSKTFVGAEACKACHAPAHAFWSSQVVRLPAKDKDGRAIVRMSGHARAWDTLVADDKDSDRSCVGCHSVGFAEAGGACKTSDIVSRGLQGVQCESCHGPGSVHAASARKIDIVRAPEEAQCRACHRVPHIATTESFVFSERLRLVTGPGHGAPLSTVPLSTVPSAPRAP